TEVKKWMPKLDFIIDCVGSCDVISMALQLIKPNGVIGVYGVGMKDEKILWSGGPYLWKLHSVQMPIPSEIAKVHDDVVRHIREGSIDLKDYVTHVLPLEDFKEGFRLIRERKALKVVLSIYR
ncbi:MAG: hypothetical protein P4M02_03235, partial [Clostridia bacterium]|nr:hypothetical protein [Clostridia bacterium]